MVKYLLLLLLFVGSSFGQDITIAVLDFEGKGVSQAETSTLTDRLRDELFKTGVYNVLERGLMDEILKEQGFQQTGCTTSECAVEVGNLLGVSQMLGGSIGKVGNIYTVSARIIDVETGEVLKSENFDHVGDIGQLLVRGMNEVIQQLVTGRTSRIIPTQKEFGSLYITTLPKNAKVIIDGKKYDGATPLTLENISVGTHKVQLMKGDYEATKSVQVNKNEISKVDVVLSIVKENLDVFTHPPGATVTIDNSFRPQIGKTPLTIKNLDVGVHDIEVTKNGYVLYQEKVYIKKDEVNKLDISLEVMPRVLIKSNPSWMTATISQGNRKNEYKYSPKSIEVNPGLYNITISRMDYESVTKEIILEPGDVKTVEVSIPRKTGSIAYDSPLKDLDYEIIGENQLKGKYLNKTIDDIPTGDYTIIIKKPGYFSLKQKITVKWNNTTSIPISLTSIASVEEKIKTLKWNRNLLFASGCILAGVSGYFKLASDKHYNDYLAAGSNAGDLRKIIEMEDALIPIALGMGGICFAPAGYYQSKIGALEKQLDKEIMAN